MEERATCFRHPGIEADSTCAGCLKPICRVCTTLVGPISYCPTCAQQALGRQALTRIVVAALVAAGVGAAAWWLVTREPSFDYGKDTAEVRRLAAQLDREPCDRETIIALTELMRDAGDPRGALARAYAFFDRCGEHLRLRWVTYSAHKRLSEHALAAREASVLIDSDPHDKDYWWWRGVVYETSGELEKAAADYRQAILVEPRLNGIPFNLADVYERLKDPCAGIVPIEQYLYYHPEARENPNVAQRLARLYGRPECAPMQGRGKAVIRFSPAAAQITTRAAINGQTGQFLLDTGASYVVLHQALATRAGVVPRAGVEVMLQTATGVVHGQLATLEQVAIDGLESKQVPAVIVPEPIGELDGLLGLSFLSRFRLTVDHAGGVAELNAARR